MTQDLISIARKEVKDDQEFVMMQFEGGDNNMRGKFQYAALETRLRNLRTQIDAETEFWIALGKKAHENLDRVAVNLSSQFEQCQSYFATNPNGVTITLEIEKDNPFVWTMVPTT